MPTFDDILKEVGEFGKYQQRIFLLLCLTGTTFAFMFVGIVFIGYTPRHWCRSSGLDNIRQKCNLTVECERSYTIPQEGILSIPSSEYSQCLRYDINWNNPTSNCSLFTCNGTFINTTTPTISCTDGWNYEGPRSSIVTEFNLVCGEDWKKDLTQAMLNVGFLIGAVIIGYSADRFGRKPCYLISCFGIGVCGMIVAFAPSFPVLVIFHTLQGMFGKGAWITCYVMVTELVGSQYRRVVGIVAQIFFTFGVMVLPGIAYLLKSWQWLQLALTLPNFLFLTYYWLVPESPRWLLNRQRTEETMKIARKIAKQNQMRISDSYIEVTGISYIIRLL
ncbi:solute carrier family 22 member 3-like [Protopterus annectens]|uniref:solute carrier family 22 member 3-like n=1 Tax=Protopterus annectens TaxID=7888 RepID=UPI001CFB2A70|nr:solute carrier family 22 member 3-like [Protopterus annectens]